MGAPNPARGLDPLNFFIFTLRVKIKKYYRGGTGGEPPVGFGRSPRILALLPSRVWYNS
jgi:hypothetical protein